MSTSQIALLASVQQFYTVSMACISTAPLRRAERKPVNRLGSGHRAGDCHHRRRQPGGCRPGGDVRPRAFVDRRWAGRTPADRERILLRFADLVEQHGEELAQLETLEQGKSIAISRAFEVGCTLNWMRYTAGLTTKISGRTLDVSIPFPQGARYRAWTKKSRSGWWRASFRGISR